MKDECIPIKEELEKYEVALKALEAVKKTINDIKSNVPRTAEYYLNATLDNLKYTMENIEKEIKVLLYRLYRNNCIEMNI